MHKEAVGGEDVVDGIVQAYNFGVVDPFRASTNNKGVMNGIVAVVSATGNDHRAIESGAHAFAIKMDSTLALLIGRKTATAT